MSIESTSQPASVSGVEPHECEVAAVQVVFEHEGAELEYEFDAAANEFELAARQGSKTDVQARLAGELALLNALEKAVSDHKNRLVYDARAHGRLSWRMIGEIDGVSTTQAQRRYDPEFLEQSRAYSREWQKRRRSESTSHDGTSGSRDE